MRCSHLFILPLFVITACGCDRDSGGGGNEDAGKSGDPVHKPSTVVEVQALTPLQPGRRTHVAPDGYGRLFWVQESPEPARGDNEIVFSMTDGGLPQPTKLTSAAVLQAMGQAVTAPPAKAGAKPVAASGSIQSLAVGPDKRLYFYFSGGRGKVLLAALGAFDPPTGQIEIVADAKRLEGVSGLVGLELARGSVVRSGDLLWVWLRSLGGYAMLTYDTAKASGPELRRPFERVSSATSDSPDLTVERDDLGAAPAGNGLLFWDRRDRDHGGDGLTGGARVWKVEPTGSGAVMRLVPDVPPQTPPPGVDDRGRLVFLVPNVPDAPLPPGLRAGGGAPAVQYPAVMLLGSDRPVVLGKDRFEAPPRVRLGDLTPNRLWRDRSGWVTYDTLTGELLRFRVVER
jgi:hypothetical protein